MPELHTLALFSAAVLGLLLAPGPNMAFLFAHGLAHGPRAGVAAATGSSSSVTTSVSSARR